MDTQFSSAIHALILISESEEAMNSEQIATSVGTNSSYIRKLTARLKKAGIIEARRGISGFKLLKNPKDIPMLEIYQAVTEAETIPLFDIHKNPNDSCIVGQNIQPVLHQIFHEAEAEVKQKLQAITLADCIDNMRNQINENRKRSNI